MSKRCDLMGTGVMTGNNVSHAVNRTKRRFMPNLHTMHLHSESLRRTLKLKTTARTLRTIDAKGGIDGFLKSMPNRKLSEEGRKLKRQLLKELAAKA